MPGEGGGSLCACLCRIPNSFPVFPLLCSRYVPPNSSQKRRKKAILWRAQNQRDAERQSFYCKTRSGSAGIHNAGKVRKEAEEAAVKTSMNYIKLHQSLRQIASICCDGPWDHLRSSARSTTSTRSTSCKLNISETWKGNMQTWQNVFWCYMVLPCFSVLYRRPGSKSQPAPVPAVTVPGRGRWVSSPCPMF